MEIQVCQAEIGDEGTVSSILAEASNWLESRGMGMWHARELSPARISSDVASGLFFLGKYAEQAVGTIKFQLSDPEYWPDVPQTEAAFIHRLAVRREFAGGCVSSALLRWAVQRTGSVGRRFLRLDCEASRPKLRGIYERFGFRHHSDREVGPFFVARYELEVGHIDTPLVNGRRRSAAIR